MDAKGASQCLDIEMLLDRYNMEVVSLVQSHLCSSCADHLIAAADKRKMVVD